LLFSSRSPKHCSAENYRPMRGPCPRAAHHGDFSEPAILPPALAEARPSY
jgi:hypothetical protein